MIWCPCRSSKKHLKLQSFEEWNEQWLTTDKAKHTKLFFPTIQNRLKAINFETNFQITHRLQIFKYISSHGYFNSYLMRFNLSDHWKQTLETSLHLLLECDKYLNEKSQLINLVIRLGLKWPIKPHLLIENKHLFIEFKEFLQLL